MNKLDIKMLVESMTGITDISTSGRTQFLSEARYVYYGLCKRYLEPYIFTYRSVGECVNRDHASAIHGVKRFELFYDDKTWFGKYLYDLCVTKIETDNYLMRLRNRQLKKQAKCMPSHFKIPKR